MATYVLVHGGWHTGELLEGVAAPLRAAGHQVHLPTLRGNAPGDRKSVGLDDAIDGLVGFCAERRITDAVMFGHSYGGMVITGAADRVPAGTIRRLVYGSAFVPNDGEALYDLLPPHFRALLDQTLQPDGSVMLPWPVWREAFINDADEATAKATYAKLNPHPYKTATDKIR